MVSPKKCWRMGERIQAVRRFYGLRRLAVTSISIFISGFRRPVTEDFAANLKMRIRVLDVGEIVGRADNIGHGETGLLQGGFDGLEAVSCLARDIRGHGHGGVIVAGGTCDKGEIAVDDRAAVASGLFERRAGGNETSGHGTPSTTDLP
jgi:hypothetical protein